MKQTLWNETVFEPVGLLHGLWESLIYLFKMCLVCYLPVALRDVPLDRPQGWVEAVEEIRTRRVFFENLLPKKCSENCWKKSLFKGFFYRMVYQI